MNLYNYYNKPEILDGFDDADMNNPTVVWDLYAYDHIELEKRILTIAKSAKYAYKYAMLLYEGPFPLGEPAIATSAQFSYQYAVNLLEKPFPLGEKAISTNADMAFEYAKYCLNGRFAMGELAIATSAARSYDYARFLEARFTMGERVISTNAELSYKYSLFVIRGEFPLGEPVIMTSKYATDYKEIIKLMTKE